MLKYTVSLVLVRLGNPFVSDQLFRTGMIADPEPVASELRWLPGIKDVEIVQFPWGKELWVVLRDPIHIEKLRKASGELGYTVAKSGSLASKLPRSLAEMIWDGVTHVVTKHPHGWKRLRTAVGLAPVAKIAKDLATGDTVYQVNDSDGLKILQDYLKS